MTRRVRNHPVQFIPTQRRKHQLDDLARWWDEGYMSRIVDRAVAEAWEREQAKRQQEQQGEGEA